MPAALTAEVLVFNARTLASSAAACATALDLCAPVAGRRWTACCCWCLDRVDMDAPAHRLSYSSALDFPGGCALCPVNGADVLVAALPA